MSFRGQNPEPRNTPQTLKRQSEKLEKKLAVLPLDRRKQQTPQRTGPRTSETVTGVLKGPHITLSIVIQNPRQHQARGSGGV